MKEYELCEHHVSTLMSIFWPTAGVFVPGTVAGVVFLAWKSGRGWSDFALVAIAGFAALVVVLAWYVISRRRVWVQRVIYFRMQELEDHLHFRRGLYIDALDNWGKESRPSWQALTEEERSRLTAFLAEHHRPLFYEQQAVGLLVGVAMLAILAAVLWHLYLTLEEAHANAARDFIIWVV